MTGKEGHPESMETTRVSERETQRATGDAGLVELCPACHKLIDVGEQTPLQHVRCPICGQVWQAARQFNNYRLVALIGEGGMGSVFKAVDLNLKREVALKILKKEFSSNEAERAKLEEEARITASINHPHVVKVFSFGEDHGQFYLAMELAEKGSLDDLMEIQQRVAEIQVLKIGIQIAEGLDAALERNLIHRDIKPGNILFSDPHTAKLVDFGLAIVMDEVAYARGEIWGTPYYIAPEKLNNQPEDFRSDIYSLGGTLFHALAGRPPYDAAAASTVALKQLMSQSVSIQTFAPNVSGETAYVINRMLAKDPEKRYASYADLIEHLSYARNKLQTRDRQTPKPQERITLESQSSRNLAGLLSLGLLLLLIVSCAVFFFSRGTSSQPAALPLFPAASSAGESAGKSKELFLQAVQKLALRHTDKALSDFDRLAVSPNLTQPLRSWIRLNKALASLVAGDANEAARRFGEIGRGFNDLLTNDSLADEDRRLASFAAEASKQLSTPEKPIPPAITHLYSNANFEAFGLFCFALHNWEIGAFKEAGAILHDFLQANIAPPDGWIEKYKPLGEDYDADCRLVTSIEERLRNVIDVESARFLLESVQIARRSLRIGGRAEERLRAIEQQLMTKRADLESL